MQMEINVQDLLAAVESQRNTLASENAQLKAYIAKLERKISEQSTDAAKVLPMKAG
jgi:cell division septum initiation protein DivIVA